MSRFAQFIHNPKSLLDSDWWSGSESKENNENLEEATVKGNLATAVAAAVAAEALPRTEAERFYATKEDLAKTQLALHDSTEVSSNKVVTKMQWAVGIAVAIILAGIGAIVSYGNFNSKEYSQAKFDASIMKIDGVEKSLGAKIDTQQKDILRIEAKLQAVDAKLQAVDQKLEILVNRKP